MARNERPGLFARVFGPIASDAAIRGYFQGFTAYSPVFMGRKGGLYEMGQTRAAIHAIANHSSKLKPTVIGSDGKPMKRLSRELQFRMNPWQNTSQFLYRTRTIYEVENTVFLVPILDRYGNTVGAYPVIPSLCEVVESVDSELYLRFQMADGKRAAVEYSRCGVMPKMQYKDDFFGESNSALNPTLDLINFQNQGIIEGIKQAAAIRFMAKLGKSIRPEDLKAERDNFRTMNLGTDNNGGVLMFDTKYAEVKQIESKPFIVDDKQMAIIDSHVHNYFGTNDKILRNEFDPEIWAAFYEGNIEPWAVLLSLVLTCMWFTPEQIANGAEIIFTANRLQFLTPKDKLDVVTQLFDRGMMCRDEGREIFQMDPLPEGEGKKFYIRGEYIESANKKETQIGTKEGKGNAN